MYALLRVFRWVLTYLATPWNDGLFRSTLLHNISDVDELLRITDTDHYQCHGELVRFRNRVAGEYVLIAVWRKERLKWMWQMDKMI